MYITYVLRVLRVLHVLHVLRVLRVLRVLGVLCVLLKFDYRCSLINVQYTCMPKLIVLNSTILEIQQSSEIGKV